MFIEAKDDGGGGDNWTTGAISHAKIQSDHYHQQNNIQFFLQAGCPSCRPTNSVKAPKGKISHSMDFLTPSSPGGLPTLSLTINSSWLLWGRVAMPLISPLMPVPQQLIASASQYYKLLVGKTTQKISTKLLRYTLIFVQNFSRTIYFCQWLSGDVDWLQSVKSRCHCKTAGWKTGRQKTCIRIHGHTSIHNQQL